MSDMSIDEAQQLLGDLGYTVTVDEDNGSIVGDQSQGRHHAMVAITPGHTSQLVTQWWSPTPDAPREQTCQYGPDTVQQAVECATAVAGVIRRAHEADQVPAIFYDQLTAEYAGKHREADGATEAEDAGVDFPGLDEACYEADGIEWADAEAAQDGAEPESAVTS